MHRCRGQRAACRRDPRRTNLVASTADVGNPAAHRACYLQDRHPRRPRRSNPCRCRWFVPLAYRSGPDLGFSSVSSFLSYRVPACLLNARLLVGAGRNRRKSQSQRAHAASNRQKRELYGRALVVIAAEQYACRLVVPSSQRFGAKRWPSHKDHAAKALQKLAGPHLPATLKQLESAIAKAGAELHEAQEQAWTESRNRTVVARTPSSEPDAGAIDDAAEPAETADEREPEDGDLVDVGYPVRSDGEGDSDTSPTAA
jgi:hypothetical protein